MAFPVLVYSQAAPAKGYTLDCCNDDVGRLMIGDAFHVVHLQPSHQESVLLSTAASPGSGVSKPLSAPFRSRTGFDTSRIRLGTPVGESA
jgi:hypothetical protein